jgi:acyl carrier protein
MRSHLGLAQAFVKSLDIDIGKPGEQDLENIVAIAFERYSRTASLIGTPETCVSVVAQLQEIGVDEIACLIDWMDNDKAMQGLEPLRRLRTLMRQRGPSKDGLLRRLRSQLPHFMVPSAIVVLDQMPLTSNGKTNRKALPAPDLEGATVGYVGPRTPTEETVVRIWCEVLDRDRVGVHDQFFDLGGHSLLAMRAISKLSEEFELDITPKMFFDTPTPATMATLIETLLFEEIANLSDEEVRARIEVN